MHKSITQYLNENQNFIIGNRKAIIAMTNSIKKMFVPYKTFIDSNKNLKEKYFNKIKKKLRLHFLRGQ